MGVVEQHGRICEGIGVGEGRREGREVVGELKEGVRTAGGVSEDVEAR